LIKITQQQLQKVQLCLLLWLLHQYYLCLLT